MKDYLALLITGVGIGFFLGLSESPLLSQILVPILTVIAGLLSILTGQKNIDGSGEMGTKSVFNKRISPLPIMWIIIGMVVGSSVGLLAKNYDIFRNRNLQLINQIDSESDTVLHESQEEICSIPHICILKGAESFSHQ